ncbi:hypothetical protein [Rhizobium sp. CF142]|uniref:hypothetical protein n=1 Tax=Rhizobium sp. CF142 TaxID=1144314 RepID=UPI00026F0376|nr:hypothetical protein [Rhizobium sp. CF142]EJJ25015.1 hypothetical protein PMI11_06775 [Rhizobium sp. CF142]
MATKDEFAISSLDQETAVSRFILGGLKSSASSEQTLLQSIRDGRLVDWQAGAHRPVASSAEQLLTEEIPYDTPYGGLRLITSLRWPRLTRRVAASLRDIVEAPGYQAASTISPSGGNGGGLASFAIDPGILPARSASAALSWPLSVMAADENVLNAFARSNAVGRGFVDLYRSQPGASLGAVPAIGASIVDIAEPGFDGQSLALSFLAPGQQYHPLPETLTFEDIAKAGSTVFLPVSDFDISSNFSNFVYNLSHNLPVDVAAWDAARLFNQGGSPLVFASRAFLNSSRLSSVIPNLTRRLQALAPDRRIDLSPYILSSLQLQPADGASPRVAEIVTALNNSENLRWDHESDTATGIMGLTRALRDLETGGPVPPAPAPQAEAPQPQMTAPSPAPAQPAPAPQAEAAPPIAAPAPTPAQPAPSAEAEPELEAAPLPNTSPPERPASVPIDGYGGLPGDDVVGGGFPQSPASREAEDEDVAEEADSEEGGEDADAEDAVSPPKPPPTPGIDADIPPEEPSRYTDIKLFDELMDQELTSGYALLNKRTYALDVAIRVKRQGLGKDRADQPAVKIKGQQKTETVWVVLTNQSKYLDDPAFEAFRFDRRFEKLTLPVSGDSEDSARFEITPMLKTLQPLAGERHEIGIRLYHKLNLIDQVNVSFFIAASVDTLVDQPAIQLTFKHPEESDLEPLAQAPSARKLTISVDQRSPGQFRFALLTGNAETGEPALFGTRVLTETLLNSFVSDFREILLDAVFGPALETGKMTGPQRDETIKKLSLLGTRMMQALFDTQTGSGDMVALGEMLKSGLPDASLVQISLLKDAKDFVLPWQILTIEDDVESEGPASIENLWGWRYILEIKRCGDGANRRPAPPPAATPIRIKYGRWNFFNEPQHFAHLQALAQGAKFPTELTAPVIEDGDAFVMALQGGMDLLYVYAHGHAGVLNTPSSHACRDRARTQIEAFKKRRQIAAETGLDTTQTDAWIETYERYLDLTQNEAESLLTLTNSDIRLARLVAAKSPDNRQIRFKDAPIVFLNTCQSAQIWNAIEGSFVGFFLSRDARAVLGTETTIPVVVSEEFGRLVLDALFKGATLGEAVLQGRRTLLAEKNNPLGICYTVYGAADARIGPENTNTNPGS